jgi:2-polyprenyl-6-methoxyphenol hydroxylase-like FAD-dependent oxidoreductase
VAQVAMFARTVLDMSDFPTRHPCSLGIWQNQIERIMAAWIAELPVRIYYGCEVTGFAQDDTGVDVELSDDQSLRAQYLVGCDGGRSVIRKAAGIELTDVTNASAIVTGGGAGGFGSATARRLAQNRLHGTLAATAKQVCATGTLRP